MRKVYTAATLADAHLVAGLLVREGIAATVMNENAQGGLGEIPFTHAWPEVWVEEAQDVPRALEVIRSLERADTNRSITCKSCGESNPGTFELCWNCGALLEP